MSEKSKEWWEKAKGFFGKINKKTRLLLLGLLIATVLVVAGIAMFNSLRPYEVLFADLTPEDAKSIVTVLEEAGVTDYRLEDGNTVTVPSGMEQRLKAQVLMQGYPKSGFAYDTYRAGVGTMSTESDRNMAYLQDLQDRMSGVVRLFDGVKDAVVTIVPQEDSRYILDREDATSATASVAVILSSGNPLSDQTAAAIRNLVSRSVKGLEIGNIEISDDKGNVYASESGDIGNSKSASMLKQQLEAQENAKVRNQILQVLSPLFGTENLSVAVNITVDVSHTVGETTTYDLPDWADDGSTGGRGIIGRTVYDNEVTRGENAAAGGVAGAETNADIPTYPDVAPGTNGDEPYVRNSGEVNYNNNKEVVQSERSGGVITDVMVSVVVNNDVTAGVNRENLTELIARASGIKPAQQAECISLYFGKFYASDAEDNTLPGGLQLPFDMWVLYAAAAGLLLLLVLLIVIFSLRRKKKKKLSAELSALLDEDAQPGSSVPESPGVDIMTIKTEKSMELRKTIRQFAEENPEIAAFMIKSWLKGEEENHA